MCECEQTLALSSRVNGTLHTNNKITHARRKQVGAQKRSAYIFCEAVEVVKGPSRLTHSKVLPECCCCWPLRQLRLSLLVKLFTTHAHTRCAVSVCVCVDTAVAAHSPRMGREVMALMTGSTYIKTRGALRCVVEPHSGVLMYVVQHSRAQIICSADPV